MCAKPGAGSWGPVDPGGPGSRGWWWRWGLVLLPKQIGEGKQVLGCVWHVCAYVHVCECASVDA